MGNHYTALQWMAPQLARSGLLLNEHWVERHAAEACALYADKDLHPMATLLAVLHEHALDYLKQAPVLVLAVTPKTAKKRGLKIDDRQFVAYRIGPMIRRGLRLKSLLAEFGMPLPMRKLQAGEILARRSTLLVDRLAKMIEPSTLSQAIPDDSRAQHAWMLALETFDSRTSGRVAARALGRARYAERFAWAAAALTRAMAAGETADANGAGDLVDFLMSDGYPFNPRWSWLRAIELSNQWHRDQLATAGDVARLGFAPDKQFDFAPFPDSAELAGLEFVALKSVLDLREDGRKMRHCVGGYHAELAAGHRFYSIRRAGQRLATAQLVHTTAVQVKGPQNAAPKREVMSALGKFLAQAGGEDVSAEIDEPEEDL